MNPAIGIVDDCKELRHLITLLVEETLNRACVAVGSLLEATLRSEELLNCAVILVDINLGPNEPDGVSVYEWLKEKQFSGRILFFTGHAKNSPVVREACKTGVAILEKPMDPYDIVKLLKRSFENCDVANA